MTKFSLSKLPFLRRPSSTGGRLVYAIGDVHGRADLFEALLLTIVEDFKARAPAEIPILVMLGDYIDRGPRSRSVLEILLDLEADSGVDARFLKGNHEQMMLRFLENASIGAQWCQHGGAETLASYGVEPAAPEASLEVWEEVRLALVAAMPPPHLELLKGLSLYTTVGDYLFVHAGVRPGIKLSAQGERDLLWIREPFLRKRRPATQVVVHGHTPMAAPTLTRWRIGMDTGAYVSNILSAICLQGETRSVLDTREDGLSA